MCSKKILVFCLFVLTLFAVEQPVFANDFDPPPDYLNSPKDPGLPRRQNRPTRNQAPKQYAPRPHRIKKPFRTHRFNPIGVLRFVYFGNGDFAPVTDSFGLSFGLKILQPLELEVGASFFDLSHSFFANTGFSWEVLHARGRTGAGLEMRVSLLGGYRYMRINDDLGIDQFHAVTASGAVEFNLWLAPRFGFQLQFAGGLGMIVSTTDPNMPIAYPEFRTSFGFLF